MTEVGIRALKQNASAVVASASTEGPLTITDRGRPVARLIAIGSSRLEDLSAEGRLRPARRALADLDAPEPGPLLSEVLAEQRADERY